MQTYFKGLSVTYFVTLIFTALGWISVDVGFEFSKLVVPFLLATIIWSSLFIASMVVWMLIIVLMAIIDFVGIIIGFGVLGYMALMFAQYLMPTDWITFTNDNLILVVIGAIYAIESLVINDKKLEPLFEAIDETDDNG